LVGFPLLASTAFHLRGMESTRSWQILENCYISGFMYGTTASELPFIFNGLPFGQNIQGFLNVLYVFPSFLSLRINIFFSWKQCFPLPTKIN